MATSTKRFFNLTKGQTRFEVNKVEGAIPALYLYDEISPWGITAQDFVAQLADLYGSNFDLHVNSPGGDVFDGLAILNSLRAHDGHITAYVDGIAASAASFILMGCDEIVMQPNTEMMIHDAWGLCIGNASDMQYMADRLNKTSNNIADVYARKAGGSVDYWRGVMQAETWFSPSEAVAAGLADRETAFTGDGTVDSVAYDLSRFHAKTRSATVSTVEANTSEVKKEVKKDARSNFLDLLRQPLKEA